MNTLQFGLFFFCTFLFIGTEAIFGTLGTAATTTAGALSIPLLGATAGTLATPLAVLGLLKLGAAALIAGGYIALDGLKGGDDEGYYESSGYQTSSGYGYHRRRRSAVEGVNVAPNQDALFALISSVDTHGCGKQLVCELEAKNPAALLADEKLILSLFGDKQKKGLKLDSAKSEYEIAAQLGQVTKSQIRCRQRFVACPYTAEEMMDSLRQLQL